MACEVELANHTLCAPTNPMEKTSIAKLKSPESARGGMALRAPRSNNATRPTETSTKYGLDRKVLALHMRSDRYVTQGDPD